MEPAHPFVQAVDIVGNNAMAMALDVSPQMISKMVKAATADPYYLVQSNHLRAIERVTDGRVKVLDLVIERPKAAA